MSFIILVSSQYVQTDDTLSPNIRASNTRLWTNRHDADREAIELAHSYPHCIVEVRNADTLRIMTTIIVHNIES